MSLLLSLLFALCCAASLGLAIFIYLRNPQSAQHRAFAGGVFFLFVWLVTLYVFDRQTDPDVLTLLGRINIAAMLPVVVFAFLQVREVLCKPFRYSWLLWAETALLAALTLFTPLIDRAEIVQAGQHVTLFGPLYVANILHVISYLAVAIVTVVYGARSASRQVRSQLSLVGAGLFATAVVAITCDLVLPYLFHIFALQEVGALSTLFYFGALGYAISVHHLFDVRILVKRTLVFAFLLAFVLAVYTGIVLFLAQSFPYGGSGLGRNLLTLAGVLVIAFSFDPLRRWLEAKTDRFLYRREYAREEALSGLARDLTDVFALDDALTILLKTVQRLLHLHHAAVFVFEPGDGGKLAVQRMKQVGYASDTRLFFKELDTLTAYCTAHPSPLRIDVLTQEKRGHDHSSSPQEDALDPAILHRLNLLNVSVVIPLHLNQQLAGLLLLGKKRSGASYTGEDLDLLDGVSLQALSSLQKARLFESDRTKSEFVSIAAHELLTPIAAVQGYLSMILDEHMGAVDEQAHDYLSKAYPAIQRLQMLVRDLLSVSRLEAGRISITPQAFDGVKLLQDAIDQLAPMAKEKKLTLQFMPLTTPLPPVWADPGRTMEVLVNLIGNALKYTLQGSVTLQETLASVASGEGKKNVLQIRIADSGLGMDREALSHLFEKFYRAPNAQASGIQGTGLGLYITKAMVEKMGGTISVQSTLGVGSTFTLTLPLAEQDRALSGAPV